MVIKKENKLLNIILSFIVILTFFLLGVFYSDKIELLYIKNFLKNKENYTLIKDTEKINNDSGIYKSFYELYFNFFKEEKETFFINDDVNYSLGKDLDLKKFWNVYNIIKKDFYGLDGIKKSDLVDGMIKGLVDSLGDKHSEFMTSDETKQFNNILAGDFEGIGAVVEKTPIGIKIERLIKGSPAKKFGLLKGDILIKANEFDLIDLDLYDAVDKIKGKAGTKVLLKILRAGESDVLEIEVVRDKIKIPSVETKEFKGFEDIGYISLNMYGFQSAKEFSLALKGFKNKKGIIIDLRDNGGGLLMAAVQILSEFIENSKVLVTTKYKNSFKNEVYKSINNGIYNGKIVVLINGNSASASEITAGALKDYNKAILIGENTYGKGSVQEPFQLSDKSSLKLTIAKWFTPNDNNIDGVGIKPDIEIKFKKEDYNFEECIKVGKCGKDMKKEDFKLYDRQLEKAKEVLVDFIKEDLIGLTLEKYKQINENKTNTGILVE